MQKYFLRTIFFFCLYFGFSSKPPTVQAQLLINEVHPAPSLGNEWVELYNSSENVVNLQSWKLEDQITTPSTIFSFTTESMEPHSYFVAEINNKLNNTGDGVTLKNSNNQIIDQMSYSSSQTNKSWARLSSSSNEFVLTDPTRANVNFVPSPVPSPSPLPSPTSEPTPLPSPNPSPSISPEASATPIPQPLPTPSPSPVPPPPSISPSPSPSPLPQPSPQPSPTPSYPAVLKISEIMSCPETGDHEWVEIYNPSSAIYLLQNWKIRDSTDNTRLLNGTLPAQSFTVFTLSSNILNNTGDEVNLERPDGIQVDHAEISACTKGRSFIFYQGNWQETTSITEGSANIYTPLLSLLDGDISDWSEETTQEGDSPNSVQSEISSTTTPKATSSKSKATKTKSKKTASSTKTKAANDSSTEKPSNSGYSPLSDPNSPFPPLRNFFSANFFSKIPQFSKLRNAVALLLISSGICLAVAAWNFRKWYQWYTEIYVEKDFAFN
jgi:hypothetical protein